MYQLTFKDVPSVISIFKLHLIILFINFQIQQIAIIKKVIYFLIFVENDINLFIFLTSKQAACTKLILLRDLFHFNLKKRSVGPVLIYRNTT